MHGKDAIGTEQNVTL